MSTKDSQFPFTRHSVLALVRSEEQELRQVGWDALVRAYWKPTYKYVRLRWRVDEHAAADWTQEFFAQAIEKRTFDRFDPAKARFRTFLRVCLDGFAGKQRQAAGRAKRGGHASISTLDFQGAEGELVGVEPPAPDQLDEYFHREWMRTLFEHAVDDLRAECEHESRQADFELFRRYDLCEGGRSGGQSYAVLSEEFGISVTQVTNRLHATRAKLRAHVLKRLRILCASDEEYRSEVRALLGADVS